MLLILIPMPSPVINILTVLVPTMPIIFIPTPVSVSFSVPVPISVSASISISVPIPASISIAPISTSTSIILMLITRFVSTHLSGFPFNLLLKLLRSLLIISYGQCLKLALLAVRTILFLQTLIRFGLRRKNSVNDSQQRTDKVIWHLSPILLQFSIKFIHSLAVSTQLGNELGKNLIPKPQVGLKLRADLGDQGQIFKLL
ncbi:hypothetical protein PanWU01x14_017940 [Parasponia andersonii]|uniref:Uncharacterized protein n=1 Tax=Parasponia andersonii TaxID=3476 RepID=A0A2P5DZ60_PARAD|nr:hypothetical protein PanWU01x14_017940 [Parasponia andersonii]